MSVGQLEFHPRKTLRVSQEDTYRFVFTVGSRPLRRGAVLTVAFGHGTTPGSWTAPQIVDPFAPGFSSVSCSANARLELSIGTTTVLRPKPSGESRPINLVFQRRQSKYQFTVRLADGQLTSGDRVTIEYGAGPGKARAPLFSAPIQEILCRLDPDGTGKWLEVPAPTLTIHPGAAASLEVAAPSTATDDRYCSLVIAALDEFGNLLTDYEGELCLRGTAPLPDLPERVRFDRGSGGCIRVPFSAPEAAGRPLFIVAADEERNVSGWSNPIMPRRLDGRHLFWGEIHAHTQLSDGERTTDDLYTYARDVAGLDFAGQGDHIDCFTRAEDKSAWLAIGDACRKYNDPGKFATLLGFEANMTRRTPHVTDPEKKVPRLYGSFDHYDLNVYFPGDEADIPFPAYPTLYTEEMLEFYRSTECIKIIHHSASSFQGVDWRYLEFAPDLVEICSKWGRQSGLTAVFAEELERGSIYRALKERRCYATTGARIMLDFKVDAASMGQMISTHTPRAISVDVHAEAPIRSIEVIKNNRLFAAMMGSHWAPRMKSEQLVIADEEPPSAEDFYYVRVTQTDGHRAWSSPIWVREP